MKNKNLQINSIRLFKVVIMVAKSNNDSVKKGLFILLIRLIFSIDKERL